MCVWYQNEHSMNLVTRTDLMAVFGGHNNAAASFQLSEYLNSLFIFNITSRQWAYINGAQPYVPNVGVYAQFNSTNPSNFPGVRAQHTMTTVKSGNMYLFGGYYCCWAYYADGWMLKIVLPTTTTSNDSVLPSTTSTYSGLLSTTTVGCSTSVSSTLTSKILKSSST